MHSAPTSRSGGGIVSVLAVAGIVGSLMQTLVVPLVGELPRLLDASAADTSWVITVTLLVGAVATPVVGKLGDLYGKRRLMLACSVPLVAGSVVCALAGSLPPMIAGRGLQGLGVGMIPLGVSALRDLLPPQRIGPAIALMSSSMGIGGALGLPISAAVAEYADWRMLFWGSAALSLLVAALIWLLVPATPARRRGRGRLDLAGAAGLGVALVCLLLGVSKGADWGWTSGTTLGLLGAAVVVLLLWGLWELRARDPLVDLRTTARPQVLLTNAASVLVGFAMYAQSLVVMQILQLPEATGYGLGQSMLAAGLWLAPSGLMMMAVSSLGARLSAARGPRTTLFVGALVIALGYASAFGLMGWAWGLMIAGSVGSMGVGLAYGAMPALIMGAVPRHETASANSFNTLMRSIGTSVSAAVVGAVLSQMTVTAGGHVLPSESGFRTALLVGCGVALVAALVTLALPRSRPAPAEPPAVATPAPAAPAPAASVLTTPRGAHPGHREHSEPPEHLEHAERPEHPDHLERPERPEHPDHLERPERPGRPEHLERPERPVHPDHPARPTHPEHPEHPGLAALAALAAPRGAHAAPRPEGDSSGPTTAPIRPPSSPAPTGHEEPGSWPDAFRSPPWRGRPADERAALPARPHAENAEPRTSDAEPRTAGAEPRTAGAELLAENAGLHRRNQELRRLNQELHGENHELREQVRELSGENHGLRAENAELRKELDVLMQGVSAWVKSLAGGTD
ncbi:MFS transporter [Nonomuraea sp. NPDC050783]|uniref:MFS transporter n=1 Tax=Nonomuraea sp. NPDC050783 TaxID=3154634 RepID=UPI0034679402